MEIDIHQRRYACNRNDELNRVVIKNELNPMKGKINKCKNDKNC